MFVDQVCGGLQQLSCRIKPIVLGAQRVPEATLETGLKVRCQDWPLGEKIVQFRPQLETYHHIKVNLVKSAAYS